MQVKFKKKKGGCSSSHMVILKAVIQASVNNLKHVPWGEATWWQRQCLAHNPCWASDKRDSESSLPGFKSRCCHWLTVTLSKEHQSLCLRFLSCRKGLIVTATSQGCRDLVDQSWHIIHNKCS